MNVTQLPYYIMELPEDLAMEQDALLNLYGISTHCNLATTSPQPTFLTHSNNHWHKRMEFFVILKW